MDQFLIFHNEMSFQSCEFGLARSKLSGCCMLYLLIYKLSLRVLLWDTSYTLYWIWWWYIPNPALKINTQKFLEEFSWFLHFVGLVKSVQNTHSDFLRKNCTTWGNINLGIYSVIRFLSVIKESAQLVDW